MPIYDFTTGKFVNAPFPLVRPQSRSPILLTERILDFDDSARQSGLYILGKPRMGKSWFMVNLMIEDRQKGHGIFFIDPHGDTIDKLRDNLGRYDLQFRTLLLNPEDPHYSFGINLLECTNVDDIKARNDTFNRAKAVFDKLWKDTFEDKPWLQLILQNTIYAFIENQGYTLAEFPYFYRDSRFREAIVSNMRYNRIVKNYWLDFGFRSKRLQEEQLEAAHTRIEIMLGHDYVTDIVGQTKTTVNFSRLIDDSYILLVKLSTHLSDESKRIIGTILVSELLHAIQHRTTRDQFCIYIDEFQNFAGFQDFPVLITQAPKFGIATTLAHHERYGQLANNPQIIGATAAIANKVLFQITARDAHELAPEFAEAPPKEIKREDQFITSRAPVWDLLKWHDNPQIREYVNRYIRPMKERLEDITGEAEAEKLIRTEYLDEASMYRFTEHVERGGRQEANRERWESALSGTEQMTAAASGQTRRLRSLNEEVKRLRILIRNLNKLLTAIMEGSIALGQDVFGEFLIENLANLAAVSEEQKAILKIYVRFAYGGTQPTLTIPFYLAKKYRLFHSSVVMSELVAEGEYWEKREEFREKRRADMRERLERLRDHVRRGEEYIAEYDRTHTHMAGLPKFKEYYEEERWLVKDRKDRDDLEQNFETKLEESVRNFNNSFDYELLRKELVPKDITTRIDPAEKDNVMRACIKELDTAGQTALQIIREFVNFCTLLAEPENCIKVKSGQYTEREINARTEQDMIGERARELMALPKYTVYVKKLDSSRGTKIYKSTTKELPDRNADRHDIDRMITRTRETVCRISRDIQDEIYNRQMPVIENSEPPRPYD